MNRSADGCQKPSSTHLPSKNHMRTSGQSAACAITWAALQVARELGPGKRVAMISPDSGARYLSTALFAGEEK